MRHLIDTNVAIDIRDGYDDVPVHVRMLARRPALSAVTVVELHGGTARDPALAGRRSASLRELLAFLPILPFDDACAEAYGRIVAASGYSRPRILDRMIAATALVHGLTVVTANAPDFADVPGLELEAWATA